MSKCFYIMLSSQLIGNVAVVIMAKDQILNLDNNNNNLQVLAWILLSWVSIPLV